MKQSIEYPFKRQTNHGRLVDKISTLEAFDCYINRKNDDVIKDHFGKPVKHVLSFAEECHGMQLFKSGAIKPEVKQRRGYEVVQLVWER